jgi:TolB-like protein/predicted Ser/Thr protein kinase
MIGKTISRYRILEKLGEGGMGVVYKAEDTKLEREVALKYLPRDMTRNAAATERLIQEAKAAAALNHPNICTVFEIDEADGQTFIAMECVEGENLRAKLQSGNLEHNDAIDVAVQIAERLAAAHEKGIVHRDIKPANIVVTPRGRVKIMDFGLVRMAGGAQLTKTGTTMGTVAYMSPEQARGEVVDRRTDIWSLGVVLYEMVTGERPFRGDRDQAVIHSILNAEPRPMSVVAPGVSLTLDRIVERMLAKDADSRYGNAEELLIDLEGHRERPESPTVRRECEAHDSQPTIAVMPFADMSPERDQDYFCDGMAEEIINALTRVEGLRVIARTSAFAFKGKDEDIREIGRKLSAGTLLEGSVRKAGNRLRITAQLINVADGCHLWSERYDRELEDVFAVQDEIALAIVDKLKLGLVGRDAVAGGGRRTKDLEAYNLYLRGRHHWNKRTPEEVRKGLECFREAVERDPDYAPAYVGVADCYIILENLGELTPEEAFRDAGVAVAKALAIDDSVAEAHSSLGWIQIDRDRDWDGGCECSPSSTCSRGSAWPLKRDGRSGGRMSRWSSASWSNNMARRRQSSAIREPSSPPWRWITGRTGTRSGWTSAAPEHRATMRATRPSTARSDVSAHRNTTSWILPTPQACSTRGGTSTTTTGRTAA